MIKIKFNNLNEIFLPWYIKSYNSTSAELFENCMTIYNSIIEELSKSCQKELKLTVLNLTK